MQPRTFKKTIRPTFPPSVGCFICGVLLLSFSHANGSQFNHLSTSDGLKSSIIRAITQDNDGLMWIGTYKGFYQFDGYAITHVMKPDGQPFNEVRALIRDAFGVVWVATKDDGVFYINNNQLKQFDLIDTTLTGGFHTLFNHNQDVVLVFDHAVFQISQLALKKQFENPINEKVYSAVQFDKDSYLMGAEQQIYQFNSVTSEIHEVAIEAKKSNRKMQILHNDGDEIWLGRSDGLYQFNPDCQCFKPRTDVLSGTEVYAIESDANSLWIGTTNDGLFQYNVTDGSVKHFYFSTNQINGLKDNSIISIHAASHSMLWLGTFNAGVNFIDTTTLSFGAFRNGDYLTECLNSQVVYDIYEQDELNLWLATDMGIANINYHNNTCQQLINEQDGYKSIAGQQIYSFSPMGDELWFTGSKGAGSIDTQTFELTKLTEKMPKAGVFFVYQNIADQFYIGTNQGLYVFDQLNDVVEKVPFNNSQNTANLIYHYWQNSTGTSYFGTNKGLYRMANNELNHVPLQFDQDQYVHDVTGMTYIDNHGLLIAADEKYLVLVNNDQVTKNLSHLIQDEELHASVFEIIESDDGQVWMSSDLGVYLLNIQQESIHKFKDTDGLQSNDFLKISSHKGQSGKIYFGGRQGYNGFYPADISINSTPPNTIITQVSQLNKNLESGQETLGGILLDQPINEIETLELNHQDLSIGFEFAALDYADSSRNQYAYRLLGFSDDWNYVGANNRTANYTNLSPGNYNFQVKAANKDGVWNESPKELSLRVYPAPWFSPWAYATYILVLLSAIWAFIRYKTIASRKRAEELEVTVTERTQEVVLQKKMVESLLDHKNEVFANVTHEFKTPLSLILGPVDEMAKSSDLQAFSPQLSMVQRNAKRLLLMVAQILKLSQAEQDKEVIREAQAVQPTLLMLYESFMPLAKDKNITLELHNEHDVNIYATAECLETVVGNLLSNALKYCSKGDTIVLASSMADEQITVGVSDDGPGIKATDINKIFKRFTRLDNHKTIQGTGIGLSVVKEVTEANDGHVEVSSEWGNGSAFKVTFPVTALGVDGALSRVMTDQLVSQVTAEVEGSNTVDGLVANNHRVTVLIIEDNLDMQKHTSNILKDRFNCMFADRGEMGIALALKEVPDVIICDVMMPGMDGYQVTRILRHDERTSHIPIILLTALNTKESRIKGWREKIDRYMTKPFDGTELIVQLESILSIRKLLQQKTNEVISNNDNDNDLLASLELPQQDMKFINKLKAVIEKYHSNEYFQKGDLADKMAVSERQLYRKVKAMIGVNPMDMLRDYRLESSKIKLKEGFQVNQVSNDCGFSSVSYFGTCFKKKYGMTPKQYKNLD